MPFFCLFTGKRKPKRAALPHETLGPNSPAVQFDNLPGNMQAQTSPLGSLATMVTHAVELSENLIQRVGRNAKTDVTHLNHKLAIRVPPQSLPFPLQAYT